jgi:hypothetical protein
MNKHQVIEHSTPIPGMRCSTQNKCGNCKAEEITYCKRHGKIGIDVWYDCQKCCNEAHKWADKKGYTEGAVSTYIKREGSDNGEWVRTNRRRYAKCWFVLTDGQWKRAQSCPL